MVPAPREIHFENDGLYIILSDQSRPQAWHWGLYLHTSETGKAGGWVFHIRNDAGSPTWRFEHKHSENIMYSLVVILALKIAILRPEFMHGALQSFLGTTRSNISMADPNQFGRLTCRTWVMQALYEMDQGGYISILPGYTVQDIELEAIGVATLNSDAEDPLPSERLLVDSDYSKA